MKGLLFSLVVTFALMFGFYYAVSQGHLAFPFNKEQLIEMGMETDRAKIVFKKKTINFEELGFFETIHYYIEGGFRGLGDITGFSYKLIVVLIYLLLLPMFWLIKLDSKTDFHWFKIGYVAVILGVFFILKQSMADFAGALYDKCEGLLQGFAGMGISYPIASVLFCIVIPIAMFSVVSMLTTKRVVSDY